MLPLEGSRNKDKPYLMVKAYDAQAFEHLPVNLTQGRYPQRPGEIVISEQVFYNGGVEIRVGDTLTLDIGQRTDQGFAMEDDDSLSETETLAVMTTGEYTVTGLIERPRLEFSVPGYTAIAFLDESSLSPDDVVNVAFTAKNPRDILEMAPDLQVTTGAPGIAFNGELLRWMGITNDSAIGDMFETIGLIIILLVVVGSVSVIYNAFAISVSERKKQFGMLASVGATSRQIRRIVFQEAFTLGLIGIPIGILSGIGGIWATIAVINRIMTDSFFISGVELRLVVNSQTVIVSIVFIALTILLSAYIPAKRAASISPIEAIRLTTDINIKGKKLRTSRLTRWLFGIEGELALKNLKRHRKRYRATIFSLFISIVLYVSFSSFMNYGFASSEMYYEDVPLDFFIEKQQSDEQPVFYEQVAQLEEVERHSIVRELFFETNGLDREQLGRYLQENMLDTGNMTPDPEGTYSFNVIVMTIGDGEIQRYVEQLGLDLAEYTNPEQPKGILVNYSKTNEPPVTEFEPINRNTIESLNLIEYLDDESLEPHQLTVGIGAEIYEQPFADQIRGAGTIRIIVTDEVFDHMLQQLHDETREFAGRDPKLFLSVRDNTDYRAFEEKVRVIDARVNPGGYMMIWDSARDQDERSSIKTVIAIFLYGFVVLIALIGVTNIFNTISTNVALRRREFAMLKSIGMTPSGFNRMLNYESIFYGVKSLLYGLPVGILISIWMYSSISGVFGFRFMLPWKEIAVCVVAVFIIVFMTMIHSSSKLRKENIIDALKSENM